jgi:hypothetical protein
MEYLQATISRSLKLRSMYRQDYDNCRRAIDGIIRISEQIGDVERADAVRNQLNEITGASRQESIQPPQ